PDTLNANVGSLYSRVVGATRPQTGMPSNAVVFPDAVCDDVLKGKARGDIAATGPLGAAHAPFIPGSGGQVQRNMRLGIPKERFEDRRELLEEFNRLGRVVEGDDRGLGDDLRKQAYEVLLSGGVADALDLGKEDPKTVARYDTRGYTRPDGW